MGNPPRRFAGSILFDNLTGKLRSSGPAHEIWVRLCQTIPDGIIVANTGTP